MQGLSSIVVEALALKTPLTRKRSLDVGLLSCKLYLAYRRHSTTEEERQVCVKNSAPYQSLYEYSTSTAQCCFVFFQFEWEPDPKTKNDLT